MTWLSSDFLLIYRLYCSNGDDHGEWEGMHTDDNDDDDDDDDVADAADDGERM